MLMSDSNLREVVLYPTRQWGGEGLIGCGIGYFLPLSIFPMPQIQLTCGIDTACCTVYPARPHLPQQCSARMATYRRRAKRDRQHLPLTPTPASV